MSTERSETAFNFLTEESYNLNDSVKRSEYCVPREGFLFECDHSDQLKRTIVRKRLF